MEKTTRSKIEIADDISWEIFSKQMLPVPERKERVEIVAQLDDSEIRQQEYDGRYAEPE